MASTAATAVAGTALDRGLKTVSLATRLWSVQPIKGHTSRNRRGVKLQKRDRLHIGYGASQGKAEVEHSGAKFSHPRSNSRVAPKGSSETLDVLACIFALFPQESSGAVCGEVGVLPVDIIRGFNSVVGALKDKAAIEDIPDIEERLGPINDACGRILKDISEANKSREKRFPDRTVEDMDMAESSTAELYVWAKGIVSNKLKTSGVMSREAKLQVVPYIVALAYATRTRVIIILVERDMASNANGKQRYLNRASKVVDDFIEVVHKALESLMANTSLVEIALVYELSMAMYLTLMKCFRVSIDAVKSPNTELNDMTAFDDGLSSIREALHWKPSGAGDQARARTIELNQAEESQWWARFTGTDPLALHTSELRTSIDIRELSHVLGGESDDIVNKLALKPDQKSALLRLPPASTLRAALCDNIAGAYQAIYPDRPSPAPPPSFACTNEPPPQSIARTNEPPPPRDTIPSIAAAAAPPARLQVDAPRTLSGHSNWVFSVAVCADGERVVSGSWDKTVRVWSLSTGALLLTLRGHEDEVNCVAVSPDGKTAVSGSDDKCVRIWSLERRRLLRTLRGHSQQVWAVTVSPDGRTIASGSWDNTVKLWNMDTGRCTNTLTGHSDHVHSVAFSPDGETLVSGSGDNSIRVWNVCTGEFMYALHGHSHAVLSVAVTPDGLRLVSGSADRTVRVWSLRSWEEEMRFEGHSEEVSCVAVFPDSQRIASGSLDKSVQVWNLRSRALEMALTGQDGVVQSVSVSPNGQSMVAGGRDNTIKVWPLHRGGDGSGDGGGGGGGGRRINF